MTQAVPVALFSQLKDHNIHYWARCYKITLVKLSNQTFRFTDHTEPLVLFDEAEYKAMNGMDSTAVRKEAGTADTNQEATGIISDSDITYDMLQSGSFNGAQIDEYLVDWRQPFVGPIDHVRYFVREVSFDGVSWTADMTGITYGLSQPTGDTWGPMCRVPLFSQGFLAGKCNLAAAPFAENATIDSTTDPRQAFIITPSNSLWQVSNYGNDGTCEIKTGPNAGFTTSIKTYVSSGPSQYVVTLQQRTPSDLTAADAVYLLPGCDHVLTGDCQTKFDNAINFQGEPYIPGGDLARRGISIFQS
jgi:uncharacterized phage protein (TIGR02218 family)